MGAARTSACAGGDESSRRPALVMLPLLMLPLLMLAGCAPAISKAPQMQGGVVSLDYCADQMVLGVVPRTRILAVSPEASSDEGFSKPRAMGIPRVRPALEEIIRLRPRYVVRLYGGSPGIDRQLAALGVHVVQLRPADTVDAIPAEVARVGDLIGAPARAAQLSSAFRRDVTTARAVVTSAMRPRLLYMTPGDVTTGPGGLIADIIAAAGFQTVREAPGWGSLPLEAMVRQPPDAVLRAFFDSPRYRQDHWAASGHPRLQRIISGTPTLTLPGSALACGNWLAADAVRQLAALRARTDVTP